jgi:hypothetical protein
MGIKLIVEVMDHWRDAGLTKGERDDLHVIAENANDATRETFGPIHEDYILRRVDKQPESWRNSIDALKRKGVLEYAVRNGREMSGRRGQYAVYRIRALCPEAPHDGYKGHCKRPEKTAEGAPLPAERVTPQMTHPLGNLPDDPSKRLGNSVDDPSKRLGHPRDAEWVTPGMTPSPPAPVFDEPPRDQPPPPASPPWLVTGEEAEEEFAKKEDPELQDRAKTFVDKLPYDRRPSRSERAELVRLVAVALVAGWSDEGLRWQCERNLDDVSNRIGVWIKDRLNPTRNYIPQEPPASVPKQRTSNEHRGWRQDPNAVYGRPTRPHRESYRNPTDNSGYHEPL